MPTEEYYKLTSFILFKKEWSNLNKEVTTPSDEFLYWLIGFTEGDGCFLVNKRKELAFILIQGKDNVNLQHTIKNTLLKGNIIKQGPRVYRLIIQKKDSIRLILLLFNGNIIQPSRKIQFNQFLLSYNSKSLEPITYLISKTSVSLNNPWQLGFTEAEGCFTISLLSNSNAFRTRYIISQKGDINIPVFSEILLLFNVGTLEGHSKKDNYNYIVSGIDNISKIYYYFDKYPFIGIKGLSYQAFKILNTRLANKEHLNPETRKELVQLSHNINRKQSK